MGVKPTYTEVNPTINHPIHQPFVGVTADLGWVYLSISWFCPLIPINCTYVYLYIIYNYI